MLGYTYGYTSEKKRFTHVVITLEIPKDTLINFKSKSVAVKEKATYVTNRVRVLKIEDNEGNLYNSAKCAMTYGNGSLIYQSGKLYEEIAPFYFFLDKTIAEHHGNIDFKNGIIQLFYANGQIAFKSEYKNGKVNGLVEDWYENGQKRSEIMYKNGNPEGLREEWSKNGQKLLHYL